MDPCSDTPAVFARRVRRLACVVRLAAVPLSLGSASVLGGVVPDYDFQWATITHPGNRGYDGPNDSGHDWRGRGSVPYEYRIATQEITTAQWVEFVNTFSVQPDFPRLLFGSGSFTRGSFIWGAYQDPSYHGPGTRYIYSGDGFDRGQWPVFDMSWRQAAMYANWLNNGKSSDPQSLFGGAYDTSTWNDFPANTYTDALTHEPGARFWIPTLDEWMKASFYDPNKNGPNQDGWWLYANSSDLPPIPGLPGEPGATTSAGLASGDVDALAIPLGSYPTALSPWGLLDTSDGAQEWLEEAFILPGQTLLRERGLGGSYAGDHAYITDAHAAGFSSLNPGSAFPTSLRIASLIPAPASSGVLIVFGVASLFRRKRPCSSSPSPRS